MKAWRLTMAGGSFRLEDVPDPVPRPGAVIVRVHAAPLVSYLRAYVSGTLPGYHPPEETFTPGTNAVGVIEQVGPGVYGLTPGQRVLVSGHLTAAENVPEPAQALLAMTAEPASAALLEDWRDGTLAELVAVSAAAVTPVPAGLGSVPSTQLAAVIRCLVPYGGLLRGRLAAGETAIVSGATGAFGTAGVHVALAMGAARVVAAGRNEAVLAALEGLDRVAAVKLTGDAAADTDALRAAAAGGDSAVGETRDKGAAGKGAATAGADCALDMVGGAGSAEGTLATLGALARGGRLVLMGSMRIPLPIDYTQLMLTNREIIGNFMYPRTASRQLLQLAAAGLLDLGHIQLATFGLAALEAAMDAAAAPGAPLVVVTTASSTA